MPSEVSSGDFGSVAAEPLPDMLPRLGNTTLSYDNEMRLTTVTALDGASERGVAYDDVGRIERKRWSLDPDESADFILHDYTYDANGNLRTYVAGEGAAAPEGSAERERYTWQFGYDQFDRRISELAPGSKESPTAAAARELTELAYGPTGTLTDRITSRVEGGEHLTYSYAYDDIDRLTGETNPAGETWSYDYDADGNMTGQTSPIGNETEISYDALGRQVAVTEAPDAAYEGQEIERTTLLDYDGDGNLVETDAPGAISEEGGSEQRRITETSYDGRGLPWSTTIGAGTAAERTTVQEFDPNGNLRRTVNPKGLDASGIPLTEDPGYASGVGIGPEQSPADLAASNAALHATVAVYDSDDRLRTLHLPYPNHAPAAEVAGEDAPAAYKAADADDPNHVNHDALNERRYRQNFSYDPRGRIEAITSPYWSRPPSW